MPKISVIVPVYNTDKYIAKCLNSILFQQMQDFEIIVVNDGSTDNSENVIKDFERKYPDKIRYFKKSNGGLSDARNFGVNKACGDYLCFVDSDDYIYERLFENVSQYTAQNVDLIKYKCIRVDESYKEVERINGPIFEKRSGEDAFDYLYSKDTLIEPAWLYLYNRSFYLNNNFSFPVNKYHEDWAIIPFIIIMAKTVISVDIYGYYYVQSSNSITRNNNDEKIYQRAWNMIEHYDNLVDKVEKSNIRKITIQNFKIYMSNCLILKLEELPKKYHKQYIEEIKKRKLIKNIKVRNIKQFIKKIVLKININLYLKIR